jgi:hypothetical protein
VIEVDDDQLPETAEEIEALSARLVEEAVRWADSCAAERHVEIG